MSSDCNSSQHGRTGEEPLMFGRKQVIEDLLHSPIAFILYWIELKKKKKKLHWPDYWHKRKCFLEFHGLSLAIWQLFNLSLRKSYKILIIPFSWMKILMVIICKWPFSKVLTWGFKLKSFGSKNSWVDEK